MNHKGWYIIIGLLFFGSTCRKTVINPEDSLPASFQLLGGDQNDQAVAMVIGEDQCPRILGISSSFGRGDQDIYIAKVNENGSLAWQRFLGGNSNDEAGYLFSNNKKVYICGSFVRPDSNGLQVASSSDMYLASLDQEGNIWSEKKYVFNASTRDKANSICLLSTGNYAMAGTINQLTGMLLMLNSNGDTLWSRPLQSPGIRVSGMFDVCDDGTGGVMGVGYQGADSLVLFNFSSNGQLLKVIYAQVSNIRNQKARLLYIPGKEYILAFSRQISPQFADIQVRSFKKDLTFNWVTSLTNGGYSSLQNIRKTNQGDLLISGSYVETGDILNKAYFARINDQGLTIWDKYLGGTIYTQGVDAQETSKGQTLLLMNVARVNQSNTDMMMAKVDANGNWIYE